MSKGKPKKRWLQGQLRKVCEPEQLQVLVDSELAYRRRARLAVHAVAGQLLLGFRGQASKHIVPIDNCIVLTQPLQNIYVELKKRPWLNNP